MLYPRIVNAGLLLLATAFLGGCAALNSVLSVVDEPVGQLSVGYEPVREVGETTQAFAVSGKSVDQAVVRMAAALQNAGLKALSVDRRRGVISGFANRNSLLECGRVVVREGEGRKQIERKFPGNQELAVVPFDKSDGTQFFIRKFATHTHFRVFASRPLSGGRVMARVSEEHTATLSQSSLTGRARGRPETITFTGSKIGQFRGGTTCTSSGEIRNILQ